MSRSICSSRCGPAAAKEYLNHTIPAADVRGNITSHRARAIITSQLHNAKEPMARFELQAWLGHRSPEATQHYAKITPNTLARAYNDAGYFAGNVPTIDVLVDRDAGYQRRRGNRGSTATWGTATTPTCSSSSASTA